MAEYVRYPVLNRPSPVQKPLCWGYFTTDARRHAGTGVCSELASLVSHHDGYRCFDAEAFAGIILKLLCVIFIAAGFGHDRAVTSARLRPHFRSFSLESELL